MTVFRCERRRNRKYILIWALSLAVCIFVMTPVYNSMVSASGGLPPRFEESGFLMTLGSSLELLETPLGMYAFLTDFLMIAGGIFGMHLGLILFTRECTEKTGEYLFTKPCGRRVVFRGKAVCLLWGVAVMGCFYLLASFASMRVFFSGFSSWELLLVALSFPLHALFYGSLGLLFGVRWPMNRSPLLTAGLFAFSGYGIAAFARTVDSYLLSFLSPFSFFQPASIHTLGFYEWGYLVWYLLLTVGFFFLARRTLLERDIILEG